ncbi:pilus assembly protein [Acinetobacter sp. HZNU-JH01]|uniref:pilus assembly protein n=1 Tax=Acinetobacter sp. HZNU-JH01 TaxID=3136280 RepID=UPI0030F44C5E
MKNKMQESKQYRLYRQKLLATTIAALSSGLVITSVAQASDIDIYQEAKSGDVSLMMLFDISGSMGAPQLIGNASACDIPSQYSVQGSGSETSTNGSPSYTRYFCTANAPLYYYKRTGSSSSNYRYYSCGSDGSIEQDDCTTPISSLPSTSGMTTTGSNPRFWYKTSANAKFYDRITRLKDGMFDLLYGNTTKGIERIADDKIIGLSAYSFNGIGRNGYILAPARRLDAVVNVNGVTKTHRQLLLDIVASKLYARGGTPTGNAYAEAAAYFMGTRTFNANELSNFSTGAPVYFQYNSNGTTHYTQCNEWDNSGNCTFWPSTSHPNTSARTFDYLPLDLSQYTTGSCTVRLANNTSGSNLTSNITGTCYYLRGNIARSSDHPHGFNYSAGLGIKTADGTRYQKPASLEQSDDVKKCSGQGIYVLTDGAPSSQHNQAKAMRNALNGASFTCTEQAGDSTNNTVATSCSLAFSQRLLNDNPTGLKIRTAVVGFGGEFNDIPSYDPGKTQEENLNALGTINSATKAAAEWGIKGEGGWYSGNSSQDVVDSVNNFINGLGGSIPAVTTGSPTVPKDRLNPAVLQKQAYFPQFQPTPDKTYQLWAGNLKKYNVVVGVLKDNAGNNIVDSQGRIVDNYDLWSPAVSTNPAIKDGDEDVFGSTKFALKGGAWSQLKLRKNTDATVDNRKLLTNRIASGTGTAATFVTGTSLRRVSSADLTDTTYKNDANRGYLMQLLGYNVNPSNPEITATTPELRQIGAVMHSSPLLVTNKGKIVYKNGELKTENREDFVLFGTTQGLLHVVDAETGQEKFAFVPNEMIERQKEAFQKYDTTSGGLSNLYYGIDGAWTTYTEYVVDGSGNLTVGSGKGTNQKGKQMAYGGLRMGGRSYYALDLQNINDPELLFHISPDDKKVYSRDGSITTYNELGDMGQSWSKPAITWVKWNKQRKRVMFVGGGYDAGGVDGNANTGGYESDTYNQTNKKGGGVYMFDADNGKLLWWAGANSTTASTNVVKTAASDLKYSVVSEIRTEDRNGDGLADHLYFGDLGGQLFRIDLDNNAASTKDFAKTPRRLLNLNAAEKSPRFYEMPSFSVYDHAGQTFAVVSIGSGNRSLPLKDYTVGTSGYDYDAVYNIYDRDVTARRLYQSGYTFVTPTLTKSNLGEITQANRNDNTTLVAPYPMSPTAMQGWYYKFKSNKLQSAKVFSTPIALNNRLFVSTFDGSKPGLSGDCGAGVKGESFLNQFCLPYGQCDKKLVTDSGIACSTGDGCSLGAGIQYSTIVDDEKDCDPTDPTCGPSGGGNGGPGDGTNNKNYCLSTGNRGATTVGGVIATGSSRICLEPQRWYERFR